MDVREQRGREIAERAKIVKVGDAWLVPSQNGDGTYRVGLGDSGEPQCSCPDWELRRSPCKHVFAAAIVAQRVTVTERRESDGSTTRTTTTETRAVVKIAYPQNWPAYNRAQCAERQTVESLLRGLCDGIVSPPQSGRGRPRTPLSDAVFGMTMKVYSGFSARRATTDIARSCDPRAWD